MGHYPQFLISTNKKDVPGRIFLLHAKKPRFIGELITFKSMADFEKFAAHPTNEFLCDIEGEKRLVSTYFKYENTIAAIFVIDFFDAPFNYSGESRLDGLMKRVKGWLQAYYKD